MARKKAKVQEAESPREYHHHMHKGGFSLWRWCMGVFFTIIGIVYLLSNFGVLSGDLTQEVWKLWPMFIIIAGISLLYPRR